MQPRDDVTYGLDADLKLKQAANYDPVLEKKVCAWVASVSGCRQGYQSAHAWLKSGEVLCKLANAIAPGIVKNINTMNTPFKQMENIKNFMDAARELGVSEASMFGVPDLYEEKNMGTVMQSLYAFGGAVQTSAPSMFRAVLGVPGNACRKDQKRVKELATQNAGFSHSMQTMNPHENAKGIVKTKGLWS